MSESLSRVIHLTIVLLLLLPAATYPATVTVRQDGTGDFTEIVPAALAAASGDTIDVGPGTYSEQLDISKSLSIIGTAGNSFTVIDGLNSFKPLRFYGVVDVYIEGFTVQHGRFSGGGALTATDGARVFVEDCIFQNNIADHGAGAVYSRILGSHLTLNNCVLRNNHSVVQGGAAGLVYGGRMTLTNCILEYNWSGDIAGAILVDGSTLDVSNCLFRANTAANRGAAIFFYDGVGGSVTGTTFYGNRSTSTSSGSTIYAETSYGPVITNNIFSGTGSGYGVGHYDAISSRGCNVYWNYTAPILGGSLAASEVVANPQFCMPMAGNFLLSESSPAVPANNSCGVLMGAYGVGCGPVAVEETTWGCIKNMYTD